MDWDDKMKIFSCLVPTKDSSFISFPPFSLFRQLKYSKVIPDFSAEHGWWLGSPTNLHSDPIDAWAFTTGTRYQSEDMIVFPIKETGDITDFTFFAFGYLVMRNSPRTYEIIPQFRNSVQFIPAVASDGTEKLSEKQYSYNFLYLNGA